LVRLACSSSVFSRDVMLVPILEKDKCLIFGQEPCSLGDLLGYL
jgi:hypothetical protein